MSGIQLVICLANGEPLLGGASIISLLKRVNCCASSAYIHQVPIPQNLKIGIIVGKYDVKVPPRFAPLNGQIDFPVITAAHTFITNNPNTKKAVLHFSRNDTFK